MNESAGIPELRTLSLSPTAWSKLRYFRELEDVEVGGFLISAPYDLMYIEDVRLVRQKSSRFNTEIDRAGMNEFFAEMVAENLPDESYAHAFFRTHRDDDPELMDRDEELLEHLLGERTWSILLNLTTGDRVSARMHFNVGPGAVVVLDVRVAFHRPFSAGDHDAWRAEFDRNVELLAEPGLGQLESAERRT